MTAAKFDAVLREWVIVDFTFEFTRGARLRGPKGAIPPRAMDHHVRARNAAPHDPERQCGTHGEQPISSRRGHQLDASGVDEPALSRPADQGLTDSGLRPLVRYLLRRCGAGPGDPGVDDTCRDPGISRHCAGMANEFRRADDASGVTTPGLEPVHSGETRRASARRSNGSRSLRESSNRSMSCCRRNGPTHGFALRTRHRPLAAVARLPACWRTDGAGWR